jgi:hypothetical protein
MPNNDALAEESRTLRADLEGLNRQRHKLDAEVRRIESRLMAIKWASHPIGSTMLDAKGDTYQVGGYANYWMLGYKIKKDGTPGTRLVPIVTKKTKL